MTYVRKTILVATLLGMAIGWGGCDSAKQEPDKSKAVQPAAQATDPAEAKEIAKAMAELSPEDRAAAEKQKLCPVSGEALGSMGKPYKVTVKGQTFFLCCPNCEDEARKNPDTYLAKLKK